MDKLDGNRADCRSSNQGRGRLHFICLLALGFALIGLVAVVIGWAAGNYLSEKRAHAKREHMTSDILATMQTIGVGDTIPDFVFEDLHRNRIQLSSLLNQATVLVFFDPDCETCIEEVNVISEIARNTSDWGRFMFVSQANPRFLEEIADKYPIENQILYDHKGIATEQLRVSTYPFNVFISAARQIRSITAGPLGGEEIKSILEGNAEAK